MKKTTPFIIVLLLVTFDQLVKFICFEKLKIIGSMELIKNFFYLTYVENRGAAFGIFEGARFLFIMISLVAVIFCIYIYNKFENNKFNIIWKISIILISSGAIGNMIDRFFRGYVVDMIHFIFFGKDFAVFNIADIFVCVGTFLVAIIILFAEEKPKNKLKKKYKIR